MSFDLAAFQQAILDKEQACLVWSGKMHRRLDCLERQLAHRPGADVDAAAAYARELIDRSRGQHRRAEKSR